MLSIEIKINKENRSEVYSYQRTLDFFEDDKPMIEEVRQTPKNAFYNLTFRNKIMLAEFYERYGWYKCLHEITVKK